ncbi:unnamed protein product [Pieris macdunnoughi]|uniref:Uncharacterized protein n=1 Tax=Pieris macdunnoughi TaxID=345717 RepID=A0A821PYX0_9NEOP|nr:unnamed protein product [Pieris macdunnoughi]
MQQQTDAIHGGMTQRRQPELNADAVRCRPSSAFLLSAGRAGSLQQVDDPDPRMQEGFLLLQTRMVATCMSSQNL